jgi:hypothetical protein
VNSDGRFAGDWSDLAPAWAGSRGVVLWVSQALKAKSRAVAGIASTSRAAKAGMKLRTVGTVWPAVVRSRCSLQKGMNDGTPDPR